jgi:hypothetical protein
MINTGKIGWPNEFTPEMLEKNYYENLKKTKKIPAIDDLL